MTVLNMSLYSSPHHSLLSSSPSSPSILSQTLTARSTSSLLANPGSKSKLGFSIDSIVGENNSRRSMSPRCPSPIAARSPRDRSPIYRVRSPSRSPDYKRSPSPGLNYSRSDSPPSPSLVMRPIPTSLSSSSPSLLNPQSYLDQLASLKAFYEARGNQENSPPPHPLLPPSLGLHGLHPMLSGLPRHGLPGMLNLPGAGSGLPPHLSGGGSGLPPHLPREYPLYPWFINRHRFPGGKINYLTN